MTTCSTDSDVTQWPDFVGAWPRLIGRQEPEFESKFAGDESEGDRCARLGARIGMRCMPWQWWILRAVLSLQDPNEWGARLWTHRDVVIECPRQNGKTLIVVLRIIFGMLVLGEKIAYTAQEWETAKDVYNRVVDVIDRVPSLKRRLRAKPTSAGNRGFIQLGNGEAKFGPRTDKFGRGITEIDLLIMDEGYDLTAQQEMSLTGATRAAKNPHGPQVWYVSTAPVASVHPNCRIFSGMRKLGLKKVADLYCVLYEAPAGTQMGEVDAYRLVHPSLGVVGDERELEAKRRKARTADQQAIFKADYLGIGDYPPDDDEIGSPFDPVWSGMVNLEPRLAGVRTLAVVRSRNRQVWSIVAAQMTADGRKHIEVGPVRTGRHTEIAEYLVTKVAEWNPGALVIDRRNSANVLEPLLIEAGIEPLMSGTADMAHACGGLLDDALAGNLSHSDQQILNDAVASAAMRELPGGDFAWLEDDNGIAIPLVGASLAHWALLRLAGTVAGPPPTPAYDRHELRAGAGIEHFDVMTANF